MEENEVRALLSAVDAPPSRVELGEVLRDGRRQAQRRRYGWTAGSGIAAVAMLIAVPVTAGSLRARPMNSGAAPPAGIASRAVGSASANAVTGTASASPAPTATGCVPRVLPVPAGVHSVDLIAVDPTGRYIAGQEVTGNGFAPILWTDGVPQPIPVHADSAEVGGVNEHGVVVGIAENGADEWVFRYSGGKVTRLTGLPGYEHVYPAAAINSAGDIVVNAEPRGSAEGANSIAMLWRAGTNTAVRLAIPLEANVFAITDGGAIAGGLYSNGVGTDAMSWDRSGTPGPKLSTPDGTATLAYAARGDWAAGGVWHGNATADTALWNLKTGELTVVAKAGGPADSVNASGWVVTMDGALVRAGKSVSLPVPPKYSGSHAKAVSDTGLVVGTAGKGGSSQPVTWQCPPGA